MFQGGLTALPEAELFAFICGIQWLEDLFTVFSLLPAAPEHRLAGFAIGRHQRELVQGAAFRGVESWARRNYRDRPMVFCAKRNNAYSVKPCRACLRCWLMCRATPVCRAESTLDHRCNCKIGPYFSSSVWRGEHCCCD